MLIASIEAGLQLGVGDTLALVAAGCIVTYFAARAAFTKQLETLRAEMLGKVESAKTTATQMAAEVEKVVAAKPVAAPPVVLPPVPVKPVVQEKAPEPISEEVLLLIAAAVSAFLGKRARVRHARLVQPSETSSWAQQGRVFVQASHNLDVSHR